jgi:nicotinamidase-related amidase
MPETALITIDVQNDFVRGPSAVAGTETCLPAMAELLRQFRGAGLPIIHVIRLYDADGGNAEPFRRSLIRVRGPLVAPGTDGANLPPMFGITARPDAALLYAGGLQEVAPMEWLLYKPRWDAFFGTELEAHLRGLDVETLVVCGSNLPNCPRATLFAASNRDFRTVLVRDATSQVTDARLADLSLMGTQVRDVKDMPSLLGLQKQESAIRG